MTVIGLVSTMVACSSDDDVVDSPTNKRCKIVSVVSKYGGGSSNDGYTLSQFSYDNEGRIVGYQKEDKHSSHPSIYKFEYGASLILCKTDVGFSIWDNKYYLKNGVIMNQNDDDYYEYDSEMQLIKVFQESDPYYTKFYWNNGDIVKWEGYTNGKLDYEAICTYYDYPNTLSLLYWFDSAYYELPEALYAAGYYGKISKHLPKTIIIKRSGISDEVTTFSYSEFNADGYPSRVIIDVQDDSYGKGQYDLTWE